MGTDEMRSIIATFRQILDFSAQSMMRPDIRTPFSLKNERRKTIKIRIDNKEISYYCSRNQVRTAKSRYCNYEDDFIGNTSILA